MILGKLDNNICIDLSQQTELVFHGSGGLYDKLQPSYTERRKGDVMRYNGVSLHVSSILGIALSYATSRRDIEEGIRNNYQIGINLYENDQIISILGPYDIEEALDKLFQRVTYMYVLPKADFFHKDERSGYDGLGNLELIALEEKSPMMIYEVHGKEHFKEIATLLNYTLIFEKCTNT